MQAYSDNDNKFVLMRKMLQNQGEIKTAIDNISAGGSSGGGVSSTLTTGDDIVVTVAGTAVQGPNVAAARGVLVVARQGNTGNVYVGGVGVTNSSGTKQGVILSQLGMPSQFIPVNNANLIWVNADNANDAVGIIIL